MLLETIKDPSGWCVELHQDQDAQHCDPRDNDNLGRLWCWHRRMVLGDPQTPVLNPDHYEGWKDLQRAVEDQEGPLAFILPVWLHDHGQINLTIRDPNDRWDSGQVGFYFVTEEQMRKEYGLQWRDELERAIDCAKAELEEYTSWCNGDVYGYVVRDPEGTQQDSCWGHIGWKYAEETAREQLKWAIQRHQDQEREVAQLLNTGFAL
jgi:hypothetical protein